MKKILLVILLSVICQGSAVFKNTKYDNHFKKYYNKYFFMYKHLYDYKIIKAQSIQESRLDPNATSYVGARGLMQLMPGTYKELSAKTGIGKNIVDIDTNIELGIYYDYKLFKQWNSNSPIEDRFKLTFASYNAGIGHILNSQKLCIKKSNIKCNYYEPVISYLPEITGRHSKETITYVKRIFEYKQKLDIIK